MKVRVGIVGIAGYAGLELMRIVLSHPSMECVAVTDAAATGVRPLQEIHPSLRGRTTLVCEPRSVEQLASMTVDTVFLCTPNEVSHELAPGLLSRDIKVIDLSGSFRLKNKAQYPSWYGFDHAAPELLDIAVYGLPEWHAAAIARTNLIANPGCYPTSVLLPLLPLARAGMIEAGSDIVCDSKSGATGAGRAARLNLLFGEVSENFRGYNPILHRHAPEMCQELGWDPENFAFVPHLLPVNRGILSTMYVRFGQPVSSEDLALEYTRRYGSAPFVRILGADSLPELRAVVHTNFCDIGWHLTRGGRRGILFSAIDNLVKGAAGQAIQNFNIIHGFPQSLGLL
jgi:N-acetyl-gamma-glutamyl-phosphate reductase